MSDYWTDPNPKGINRTIRDLLDAQYRMSDDFRAIGGGLRDIAAQPFDWIMGREGRPINFISQFTPRPWQMTPPKDLKYAIDTTRRTPSIIPPSPTNGPNFGEDAPAELSPLEQLQYDMFQQMLGASSGGRSVDLSGYNASLKMLGRERKRMKKRYKKYQGQIADIYGTLTGINQNMIENLAPAGEAMRADLSAQEGQQAAATRSADAARLEAATQARAGLGLEDLAGQYAEGDVATEQAEGMITDRAADTTAAQNTMLANEAIARQQLTNQNLGRTIQQESSETSLQRSLEDALAAIRAERANVLTQRSQAASQASGGGPDWATRMAGLEGLMGMGQSPVAPSVLDNFMQGRDPNSQTARDGATAYNTFLPWLATNYESLPSVKLGQRPEFGRAVSAFTQAYPELANTMNNADIYNMLSQAYFSVFQGKAPNSAQ
jgi:hypothetical protein